MKKNFTILLVLLLVSSPAWAQTKIDKTFDVKKFRELDLVFEYPELVQIKVWDKDEVRIEGTVDIQGGQYDEDFELRTRERDDRFTIESKIHNLNKHRGTIIWSDDDDDDNTTTISSSNGVTIYSGKSSKGKTYGKGLVISIELVVTIPKDMEVMLNARYGMVEVLENPKSMEVDARYGGVDVTVDESQSLDINAKTQWGQIYSNLKTELKMGGNDMTGQWMKARAAINKGENLLKVESQYGNVYLRKD